MRTRSGWSWGWRPAGSRAGQDVTQTGCIGLCQYEPIVEVIEPGREKVTYVKMTPEKALEVLRIHLIGGQVVAKYTLSAAQGNRTD